MRARLSPVLLVFAIAALSSSGPALAADAGLDAAQQQRIAESIAQYRATTGAPAVSVYVDRGGSALYRADVGSIDLEHEVPAAPNSVYAMGSITKSYTAHAVLQLVGAGRLRLDDTVGALLPGYAGPGKDVTVRQLLTHTSGLPNYVHDVPGLRAKLRRGEYTREELMATFASLPLAFTPGDRWSYTNSGYYLLGLIVEKVTGKSYYDYLRQDVLAQLGVTAIWSGDDAEIVKNRVRGYERGPNGLSNAPPVYYLVPFSAGSLLSTAEQIARYRRAVFTSDKVPARVRELIETEVPLASGEKTGYLLGGLVRTEFGGLTKYAHSGEVWGFSASHAYYPASDTTIVVLTNLTTDLVTPVSLERQIARVVLGVPAPAIDAGPQELATLQKFSGKYRLGPMQVGFPSLTFLAHDGALLVGFGDDEDPAQMLPLQSAGKNRYVVALDPETAFLFDPPGRDGKSGRVVMDALNGRIPASRVR